MFKPQIQLTPNSARTNALEYHKDELSYVLLQIEKASKQGLMTVHLLQSTSQCVLNHINSLGYTVYQMQYINYKWYRITWLNE